jgi:ferritin-like metal-binding protein YciE
MKMKSLQDLFVHELKDLYSAEKQLLKALDKMIKKASHAELKEAFESHRKETEGHVDRIEKIFKNLENSPRGEKCDAMEGLIEEAEEAIENSEDNDVLDAAMIASAQRVEHYEMAGYGTARTYAEMLGNQEAVKLLEQTLDEEKAADKKLTRIAKKMVNWDAFKADGR